jgi:hypothetical protein
MRQRKTGEGWAVPAPGQMIEGRDLFTGGRMNIAIKIKTLVKEAEVYHKQGLLTEARKRYEEATRIIGSIDQIKNKASLLQGLSKKIQALDQDIDRVEGAPLTPKMDSKNQELIKKLFSFTQDKSAEAAALEEAITLSKFGQYENALKDFRRLLPKEKVQLAAAKNIIRCHLAKETVEKGIEEFDNWLRSGYFDKFQLEKLRAFFNSLLKKKGHGQKLPEVGTDAVTKKAVEEVVEVETIDAGGAEEEILDINTVAITFQSGPQKGEIVEFDVSFQTGNVVSVLIPGRSKDLAELLNTGDTLADVQFFSPIAIFPGTGLVTAKTQIKVGPRKGDFSVDIKVSSH